MLAAMPDRRSQTLERELLEFAPDAVVGVDEQGEIVLVNSRTETVFGYPRGELIGQPVEMLVPSGLRDGHVSHRDSYFAASRTRPMGEGLDLSARRKDGSEFPCEISLSTVATSDGMMALAAIRDITDRRRDRDQLRRAVRRLQAATDVAIAVCGQTELALRENGRALIAPLLFRGDPLGVVVALDRVGEPGRFDDEHQRLLEAFAATAATGVATARSMAEERLQNSIDSAEQERSRWARELHDETLQALAVLRMRLSSALREDSPESLEETSRAAVEQIDGEIEKLRRLITELRPAALDTIGLEAALQALAEQHEQTADLKVNCHFDLAREEEARPTALLETAVYRLVQEALNNAAKHSMARQIELAVRAARGSIEIEVRDDGVGFEPNLVQEGFGLVGMRERAALLGGTLEVESTRGAGTEIRAEIPLTTRAEE